MGGHSLSTIIYSPLKPLLLDFIRRLIEEDEEDPILGCWTFRCGSYSSICTFGAKKVAIEFGGLVFGYLAEDNPTALVPKHACGHDFAIIEGRFLVDYWAYQVAEEVDRPVFDMYDPVDKSLVQCHYGDQESWIPVDINEEDIFCLSVRRHNRKVDIS